MDLYIVYRRFEINKKIKYINLYKIYLFFNNLLAELYKYNLVIYIENNINNRILTLKFISDKITEK